MKIGRNDICPCRSGLKYKKCCMKNKSKLDAYKMKSSVNEIISFLKQGLKNINAVNSVSKKTPIFSKKLIQPYTNLTNINSD